LLGINSCFNQHDSLSHTFAKRFFKDNHISFGSFEETIEDGFAAFHFSFNLYKSSFEKQLKLFPFGYGLHLCLPLLSRFTKTALVLFFDVRPPFLRVFFLCIIMTHIFLFANAFIHGRLLQL
jgi:hypothetical protein